MGCRLAEQTYPLLLNDATFGSFVSHSIRRTLRWILETCNTGAVTWSQFRTYSHWKAVDSSRDVKSMQLRNNFQLASCLQHCLSTTTKTQRRNLSPPVSFFHTDQLTDTKDSDLSPSDNKRRLDSLVWRRQGAPGRQTPHTSVSSVRNYRTF